MEQVQIEYIILGWLFGLLSPGIVGWVRQNYRKTILKRAINNELDDLQGMMLIVLFNLHGHNKTLTDDFLDQMLVNLKSYRGGNSLGSLTDSILALRSVPHSERYKNFDYKLDYETTLGLPTYALPLLEAHMSDLSLFSISYQIRVLEVLKMLRFFNQHVELITAKINMTFDASLADKNHQAIKKEIESTYRLLEMRTEAVICAVQQLD